MQELSPYSIERQSIASLPDFRRAGPNPFSSDQDLGFRQYWSTISRHSRLILALIVAAELLTVLVLLTRTRLYTATSTIMIQAQSPDLLETKNQQADSNVDNFYKTQYEVLRSRNLAAMVINKLRLAKEPSFVEVRHRPGLWSWIGSMFSSAEPKMVSPRIEVLGVKPPLINAYCA